MKKIKVTEMALSFAGVVLIGTGVAFNASAALGNGPVGIVYDGLRNAAGLSAEQLGQAYNIVNILLIIGIFFMGRRYVNIGTLVYIIPYGLVVDLGGKLYRVLFPAQTFTTRITGGVSGSLMLYPGIAMYITADIGVDPFTGVVLVLRDRLQKEYRVVKVVFDVGCIMLGVLLGGRLGVITILTAFAAGPFIQFLVETISKIVKGDKKKDESGIR